jgi:hypothetical protein
MSILQSKNFWNYLLSMCCALYAPMRVLRLAAMDNLHFYVCQTDANMSRYLAKAVIDAGRCTHDETLRLMNACSQDLDEFNSDNKDDEDDEESVVNGDADEEVTSDGKQSEDGADEDDELDTAFTNDAIGAGCGQLQQVPPCVLYTYCMCKLTFSCLVIRSSSLLSQFTGDGMDHVAMRFWIKR